LLGLDGFCDSGHATKALLLLRTVSEVVKLGSKKRYLAEPAVAVILDLVKKVNCLSKH
jgi:hypothetical protein